LAHPGLVAIFDVGTVDDRRFLVMEFVEGTSVQSRLLAGPLPLGQVLRIGGVLADALAHAHLRGVVHRDVKPSNIMLDGEDLPHLTDFGIALLAGSPRLTSVHEVLGTPAYLAPEQLLDTEVGPAADVYALGLVLLECLSGEPEYASGNCTEVALSRLNRPPRIPAGLPPALIDLLTAMTATEPLDRPAAETCASRLVAALEDIGTDVVPERPVSMSPVVGAPVVRGADQDGDRCSQQAPLAAGGRCGRRDHRGGRRAGLPAGRTAAADSSAADRGRRPHSQRVQCRRQHQPGESRQGRRDARRRGTRFRDNRLPVCDANARRERTFSSRHCTHLAAALVHAQEAALGAGHDIVGATAPADHGLDATADHGVVRAADDDADLDRTAEQQRCSRRRAR
jgi:hypothetical protein